MIDDLEEGFIDLNPFDKLRASRDRLMNGRIQKFYRPPQKTKGLPVGLHLFFSIQFA